MVEDVLVNRNVRFSLEVMDEVCGELSTSDGRWSDVRQNRKPLEWGWAYGSRNDSHCFVQLPVASKKSICHTSKYRFYTLIEYVGCCQSSVVIILASVDFRYVQR